ncbi:MAG: hypothetical protein M5U08_16485 [Burkholderiales bacterium]|nr:hypothetical protein [Burkholderiales bacterium]
MPTAPSILSSAPQTLFDRYGRSDNPVVLQRAFNAALAQAFADLLRRERQDQK